MGQANMGVRPKLVIRRESRNDGVLRYDGSIPSTSANNNSEN